MDYQNNVQLSKIDIAELCNIKSIADKPNRLEMVLDVIDASMFEHHRCEFEMLFK